jgi:peptide/nickel transport system substrate-binding protein
MLYKVDQSFLVSLPVAGGELREGILGQPRFINPLLAVTDSDKDLAALIYSGLMRYDASGRLIPDLAESYTVSPEGKVYTFTLKSNATFQDGTKVTADDVIFTISLIQNSDIQSVKYADWAGVKVQKIDDTHLKFILLSAYAPFIENTTLGILPKHVWQSASTGTDFPLSNYNIAPVGSGPYKIGSIKKDNDGSATSYTLVPFDKYALGTPYISSIVFHFFTNQMDLLEAYQAGTINMIYGISPDDATHLEELGAPVTGIPLPRVFGLFLNQSNNEALADLSVRQALDMSVNRSYIVNTVLQGFAQPLTEPVPSDFTGITETATTSDLSFDDALRSANALLDKNGWKLNANGIREKKLKSGTTTLTFSISTSDAPELKEIGAILKEEWQRIGAEVTVKVFEGGYLNQNVIKPRRYDALLFGQVVNRTNDLYPFWHSSQIADPGLNIALYSNSTADSLLSTMRGMGTAAERDEAYQKFQTILKKDLPAIFLYAPQLISLLPSDIHNLHVGPITTPSERFSNVYEWYINTDQRWKIFVK